jgi:FKBP-type peptidyl-prolyl cis-trans isomerase FklB
MKSINLLIAIFVVMGLFACESNSDSTGNTDAVSDSATINLSYAYGSKMAEAVARFGLTEEERNPEKFAEGFMKGLEGDSLENAESQAVLQVRLGPNGGESVDTEAAHKIAYNMGLSAVGPLAQEVEIPTSDFDQAAFADGFRDVLKGTPLRLAPNVRDSIFQTYIEPKGQEYQAKMQAKAEAESKVNIVAGETFLAENKNNEGVITTESGLQYKIIKEGTGKQPKLTDQVLTHYHGTLLDGTVFDSSVDRGQPATFGVNQVIKGWQEGIPLMKEGAKYRFYIPQNLAYGTRGSGKIPGGSLLIFDVELIEVNPTK